MRISPVFFLTFLCLSAEGLDIFNLTLSDVPNGAGGCPAVAARFSEKLKSAAEVEIYQAQVVSATRLRCTVEITYLAQNELELVESADRSLQSPGWQGTYEKREECEADLARQAEIFSSATGIRPWASYCQWSSFELEHRPFLARVLGAGKTKSNLFATRGTFLYSPDGGWAVARPQLAKAIAEQGGLVANLVFWPSASHHEGLLTHYGTSEQPDRLWVTDVTFGKHYWDGICPPQLEEARGFLTDLIPKPIGVYCSSGYGQERVFQILFAQPEILPPDTFLVLQDAKRFSTLGACLLAKKEVEAFYRERLHKKVLGSVCSGQVDSLQIHLIEQKAPRPGLTLEAVP